VTANAQFIVATPRMAAGLLVRDESGRVLLVKPTYKQGWDIPGGYVEPGESPRQACQREVQEELGSTLPVGRLLVVDWAPHPNEGDKVLWIFNGGTMPQSSAESLNLQVSELSEAAFRATASLDDLMPDRLSRRLRAACIAAEEHTTLYLEQGRETAHP
jgi:ADP-ribose pyrophosphatase YjhB (NUDIX family)